MVNTASIAATAGLPDRAVYSASKGAVAALTRAMAADGMADGIRVNAVNPGTADTPWVSRLLDAAPDPDAERAALEARQPHGRLVSAGGGGGRRRATWPRRGRFDHRHRAGGGRRDGRAAPASPDVTASAGGDRPASTGYRCRTAAIQFPLRHPAVASVVSGMRSGGQVAPALGRFATVVPDEAWTELDAC